MKYQCLSCFKKQNLYVNPEYLEMSAEKYKCEFCNHTKHIIVNISNVKKKSYHSVDKT